MTSRQNGLTALVLLTQMMSHLYVESVGSICEPIRIPMCRSAMPYNITQMPNLLYHSTQTNAELVFEQYTELVQTNCSSVLLFYLCSVFVPVCPTGFQQLVIPPCKNICEEAKRGCEPVLRRYNLQWPEQLRCSELPEYEKGVCISPSVIDNNVPIETPKPEKEKDQEKTKDDYDRKCKCKRIASRTVRKAYLKKKFDYVLRVRFKRTKGMPGRPAIVHFQAVEVFRNNSVLIKPNQKLKFWAPTGCFCNNMMARHSEYLVMGFEDHDYSMLRLDQETVIAPWKNKWSKRIQKWNGRLLRNKQRKARREEDKN